MEEEKEQKNRFSISAKILEKQNSMKPKNRFRNMDAVSLPGCPCDSLRTIIFWTTYGYSFGKTSCRTKVKKRNGRKTTIFLVGMFQNGCLDAFQPTGLVPRGCRRLKALPADLNEGKILFLPTRDNSFMGNQVIANMGVGEYFPW